jgi:hypothetical protein
MDRQEDAVQRSSANPESERQQDGSGYRTPSQSTEASRGNVEPDPTPPLTHKPVQTIEGQDGKPIAVQEDSGITAAERANDA